MKKQKFDLKYLFLLISITLILIIGLIYLFNKNKIDNEINWMTMKEEQRLNVPLENQLPDLPNGCEVTSLSMLLNYYDIKVNKYDLADNIAHVDSFTDNGKYPIKALSAICLSLMLAGAFITGLYLILHVNIPAT